MSESYFISVQDCAFENVANKTALVTGGCSGIGLAAVNILSSLNCNVIIGDTHEEPKGHDELFSRPNVHYLKCDISKWDSITSLFEFASTLNNSAGIDLVIANAGINEYGDQFSIARRDAAGRFMEPDYRTLDVDLKGAINTVALALAHVQTRGGSIVLTASLAGYQGTGGMPIYSAAKHGQSLDSLHHCYCWSDRALLTCFPTGVWGLMQSLKHSTPRQNVAISLVAPGFVPTPILGTLPGQEGKSLDEVYAGLHAAGLQSSSPETVASAIVYLANGGLECNGTALSVNNNNIVNLEALLRDNRPEYVRTELRYLFTHEI